MLRFVFLTAVLAVCSTLGHDPAFLESSLEDHHLYRQDHIINIINSKQNLWKAGRNFPNDVSYGYLKRLAAARLPEDDARLPKLEYPERVGDDYPENFDSRTRWPQCPSIRQIYDQGNCGSCWAVSVASAITDRLCIASNGTIHEPISAQELMSCCHECGNGCQGGWPDKAYKFFKKHGLSTGGHYKSKQGCQPYEIKPCSHHTDGKYPGCQTYEGEKTPACSKKCTNGEYKKPIRKDRHFGVGAYSVCRHGAKYQLFNNGSITAGFAVFEDFYSYKSGVYTHIWGKRVGYHIVKVIGWGKENGTPYWLAANSWNSDWGDKGNFKIAADTDECSFEEFFSLTEPRYHNKHL